MQLFTLSNGLRIAMEQVPQSRSAAIDIFIGSGSRDETPETSGASHFIEHILFKGTNTRSAMDIAEQMDEMGGQLNAYTAKEHTCVYVQTLDTHVEKAFEIMADMILNSKMDENDIETEKGVILEEIGMYEDTPEELCADLLYAGIWKGFPLSGNILGTRDTVSGMTAQTMRRHMAQFYVPERMTIGICGRFDADAFIRQVEKYFGGLKNTNHPISVGPSEFQPCIMLRKKDFEQSHFIIAMEGLQIGDESRYAAAVFSSIAGGSASSRLNQRIREELGLAYSVYSFSSAHLCAGVFGVAAAVAHNAQQKTIEEIFKVLEQLKNGVEPKELYRTKEQFKAGLVMGLESNSARASSMGRSILLENRYIHEDQIIEKIDALTIDDMKSVAKRLLCGSKPAICVVGRPEREEIYQKILPN